MLAWQNLSPFHYALISLTVGHVGVSLLMFLRQRKVFPVAGRDTAMVVSIMVRGGDVPSALCSPILVGAAVAQRG